MTRAAAVSPGTAATGGHRRHRRVEQEWRRSHQDVLRNYAGQWVVLEGEEIVAHGKDPVELVEIAREAGVEVPYVFYVDPPRPGIVKIGL